ncbi:hypothetical protein MARCHEWKA_01050 [Brevundimonas phage vB_BpoS-Marchewka]|uniref:Uncharacterized protein n=1 Tax=Brevundimonas phage vB_BpoS-Marchewka TaxID=2948604 RepID=A0A9E7N4F7_9CAUD|nr:hypothetical protein MARCHEWKA_01050 [Brevundimonas phage vB_BpoS-Marchewka]
MLTLAKALKANPAINAYLLEDGAIDSDGYASAYALILPDPATGLFPAHVLNRRTGLALTAPEGMSAETLLDNLTPGGCWSHGLKGARVTLDGKAPPAPAPKHDPRPWHETQRERIERAFPREAFEAQCAAEAAEAYARAEERNRAWAYADSVNRRTLTA